MRNRSHIVFLITILLVLAGSSVSLASHIRAGEITVSSLSTQSNVFRITLTIYRDTEGVDFRFGILDFGDGNMINDFTNEDNGFLREREIVGENIEKFVFSATHEYIDNSSDFKVSFQEDFRNNGIVNIENGSSGNTPFYVETEFRPGLSNNSSPLLTIPPVDKAAVGALFLHNPGAFDPNNDSLAFELITPFQGRGESVQDYDVLNSSIFYADFNRGNSERDGPPTLTLDPISGLLTWDAPGTEGEFNVAFRVIEFRRIAGVMTQIGYVVRDMQITVEALDNAPPEIDPIGPLCIDAGDLGQNTITASDPDGDSILLEAFGEPFQVPFSQAVFQQISTSRLEFSWQTICSHAREASYEVLIKATDRGNPPLVDLASFEVVVAAPAPENLNISLVEPLSAMLTWDDYTGCQPNHIMQIWRRDDSFTFTPGPCETGIPQGGEYTLVGLVDVGSGNSFIDSTLTAGKNFCYRLVADYISDGGAGLSYASEEICIETDLVQPLILNVDVLKNPDGSDVGDIFVRWAAPLDLDSTLFERPFTYQLFFDSETGPVPLFPAPVQDTTFIIENANLQDTQIRYFVDVFNPTGDIFYQRSERATVVELMIDQEGNNSRLTFNADVPWNIIDNMTHYIFRDNVDPNNLDSLILIDSTTTLTYTDQFFQEKQVQYHYYVSTSGAYSDPRIMSPLINRSANVEAFISDIINSCIPTLDPITDCSESLESQPCETDQYFTSLTWTIPQDEESCNEIRRFNVLFSPDCTDEYEELPSSITPRALFYIHTGLESVKGCYRIESVNFLGATELSNIQEKDGADCQQLKLPNVFTPNGDGFNDLFNPFNDVEHKIIPGLIRPGIENRDCPRFVKSLDFRVYDRTGNQLFEHQSPVGEPFLQQKDVLINWDGKNFNGEDLPTGVYYYGIDILFYNFGDEDIIEKRKGWIKLRR